MNARDRVRIDEGSIHPDTIAAWSTHLGHELLDPDGLRRRLGRGTLPEAFAAVARTRPHSPALNVTDGTMTHGQLDDAAARAASAYRHLGVTAGTPLLLIGELSLSWVVAYVGALRVGAVLVLANPSSTAVELERIAAVGLRVVVGSGQGLATVVGAGGLGVDKVVGLAPPDHSVADLLLQDVAGDPAEIEAIDPDSAAILAFTSGSTGVPKCAPLSHRNLLASIRGVMLAWQWSADEHLVHSLPVFHQHGLGGIHATLLAGSQATIHDHFESANLLRTIVEADATALFAVPSIYEALLRDLGDQTGNLRRLRFFTSGSAPLPVDLARRLEALTGELPVERYGSTESGLDISNPLLGRRVAGSVGIPLPGAELAVIDESERPCLPDEAGEILIRGPQVFSGYLNSEPGTGFFRDWFRTGDIGIVDGSSGYLSVVGRSKDVIITGGMNVYPREVEDALRVGHGVRDAAVIGFPSPRWGEEVVAFIAPARASVDSAIAAATTSLAPYKRPKRVIAIETIPRSSLGKVLVDELIEILKSDQADQPLMMPPTQG